MRPLHIITPGDHFSPSTGSAVATVVHGLAGGSERGGTRSAVAVARGTYADRYASADVVEYDQRRRFRYERYVDAGLSRFGMPRVFARRRYGAALVGQERWEPSDIVCHNGVQLVPGVDTDRHRAVLYAHNDLLRTYSRQESARTLGGAALIVAVSDWLAGRLTDSLPATLHDRVVTIRNGVDLETFRPGPARSDDSALRVVFVGRVVREKGPDVLVEAMSRLRRTDIALTIVGSAGFDAHLPPSVYEVELAEAIARAGGGIRRLPFVARAQAASLLSQADVVVVPSRWPDPCPLTVLEGMACGAAVVASDIGGIPEIMGGAGTLVAPGDPDELAAALEAFAADRSLLRTARDGCLARATARPWDVPASELVTALAAKG